MLSNGACLSREYGLAAIQLRNAMQRIQDGAMIEVNGEGGFLRLLDKPPSTGGPESSQQA
jgi:pyruvate,water dikinase